MSKVSNNNIISTTQIVEYIITKYGYEKKIVENFLKSLFVNIENALINEGFIVIKGLGDFRRSVQKENGLKEIVYTPDDDLKEYINLPFSHLQTITLNVPDFGEDGVANQYKNNSKINTSSKEPLTHFQNQAMEIKEILSEIELINKENPSDMKIETSNERVESEDTEVENRLLEKDETKINQEKDDFDIVYCISKSQKVDVNKSTAKEEEKLSDNIDESEDDGVEKLDEKNNEEVAGNESVNDESEEEIERLKEIKKELEDFREVKKEETENNKLAIIYKKDKDENKRFTIWSLLLIIVAGVFVVLLVFFTPKLINHFKQQREQQRIDYIADSISNAIKVNRIKDSLKTINYYRNYPVSKISEDTNVISELKKKTLEVKTKSTLKQKKSKSYKRKAKRDIKSDDIFSQKRIYNQFITSIKLKPSTSFYRLSRKYYGEAKFWVYIYEANRNKIKNPNVISAGTIIKIPKLDKRLIDKNNPKCLDYASQLEEKYLR